MDILVLKRILILGIGTLVILGSLYFFLFLLPSNLQIPCVFYELTGLFCPGCGMSRALISLMRLDIRGAFSNNLLMLIILPCFIIYIPLFISNFIKTGKTLGLEKVFPKKMLYLFLIIVIVFGIMRNFEIFEILQPIPH